ncbi:Hypothetical protein CINCED_3A023298 [Cinara cedri]|uniref:Transposase, type 1 n=1 Tax=Cinara cedri TaxID=506608 RepID=A0A5E4N0K3_9HEMI|nr:Hypothetical protein CINCED_3A023298 [Cinara cedri]
MSIRMIAEAVNADKETVRKILHEELHMTKVCAKLVPKNLTPDQKFLRQQGQTVHQIYYLSVLATLREKVRKKRPELWKNNSWILHQDNATAHNALSVKQYLAGKRSPVLEYAPYSPDLASCDFFCFQR